MKCCYNIYITTKTNITYNNIKVKERGKKMTNAELKQKIKESRIKCGKWLNV